MTTYIHPTALVEAGARVGAGTRIWHHAHVREGATIGEGCALGKNVFVDAGVTVGHRVKVQSNVSVYAGVELADDVFVGPSAVFTNDRVPRAAENWTLSTTTVRRGASIRANATVLAGVEIGDWAMVGAGAVVVRSVKPHEVVVGNPARLVGLVCQCGSVRVKASQATQIDCETCGTRLRGLA